MPQIKSFQIDVAELGADSTLQAAVVHDNLSGAGSNSHAVIDSHINNAANPHSTTLVLLTDVVITPTVGSPLEPVDGQVLAYDSGTGKWINTTILTASETAEGVVEIATQAEVDAGTDTLRVVTPATLPKEYYIDVVTGVGSPMAMTDTTLPVGWSTTYNSVGNFTITHNLTDATPGFALSVIYNGTARVINPTTITASAITFQITDTLDTAVEGNVVGRLIF